MENKTQKIEKLEISAMDPMAQGVAKGEKTTFVPKTLPGEQVEVEIKKSSKGVRFGALKKVVTASDQRTPSDCAHYFTCSGCHYLHTNYENEIKYKEEALNWRLKGLSKNHDLPPVNVHPAVNRFGYRNRVQLHYDVRKSKIGARTNDRKIIEIQNCLLPNENVKKKFDSIYHDEHWKRLLKKNNQPQKGHLELYEHRGDVKISYNKAYSSGGFTQVNHQSYSKLQNTLNEFIVSKEDIANGEVLDLFGGSGNLSGSILPQGNVSVIDSYLAMPEADEDVEERNFSNIDLYADDCIQKLSEKIKGTVSLTIIDPPRSGWTHLRSFTDSVSPKYLIYVSCQSDTLVRDLKTLENNYEILDIHLYDFFPSTYHFETMVLLERR
jgi:23S rRNA (uracil1939-C5)-methyltransferase